MTLPVSVIIPTFNEEGYLPKLLQSLQNQTRKAAQIIVADAFSLDNTREIARSFGCLVVDGGLPSAARNNGAKFASQEVLLFLDADAVLPPAFLERTFAEMMVRNLDITSCFITPKSPLRVDHFLHQFVNHYMRLTQKFHPHIPGVCIFVKKNIHEAVSGFDQSLVLAEDHDYVKRAKRLGKFGYLKSYKIPVSVRRLSQDGRVKIALQYIAVELHLIFIGKIRRNIFNYRFGHYYKLFKDA